jgi:hypothetical protein
LATIRVPAASLEAYKVAPGWMEWSSIIVADTAASSSSSSSGSALYDPDPTSRLIINNTGSSDIVLFNDAAIPANLLGGVKAFATRHGVPKMPSGVHVVKVVTAADYAANPASPKVCYSFLVNTDYEPDAFDINVTSGDCALQINNQTDAYLEVRSTAFAGPRVAVLRPYEIEHIYRQAGEETFFAFVERPKTTSPAGLRIVNAGVYSVSLQPETTGSLTVSPTSFIATNHAAAYIKVVNNRSSAVQMYRSSVLLHDAWNRTIIPSGMSSGLYNLEMSASPLEGQSYTFLSSLAVEVATSTVFTYNSGYVYTISLGPGSQTATVANNGTYENFFP